MSTVTTSIETLQSYLSDQPVVMGDNWEHTLEPRKREEMEFHDADREGHRDEDANSSPNRRFYEASEIVRNHQQQWMQQHTPGAIFLDYACGNGVQAVKAAKCGARFAVGIDISEVSVQNANETARNAGVFDNTRFLQRDCENTTLPNDTFHACLCSGMLHHLDLEQAYPELHRIMAPGGRILCSEALAYNPVIQWYRNRTPELRTEWEKEHILGMREVRMAKQWFRVENIRFFLMAAPLATLLPAGPIRKTGLAVGHAVDAIATRMPLLRLWSWQFTFELVKEG